MNPDLAPIPWDIIIAGGIGYVLGIASAIGFLIWALSGFRLWR